MQAGFISGDNLSQLLRDVSQRKLTGVVVIKYPKYSVTISLIGGRIADCERSDKNALQEIIKHLKASRAIPKDYATEADNLTKLCNSLCAGGNGGVFVQRDIFLRAVHHRVFDALYDLAAAGTGQFTVAQKMVELDRELMPSLSVGQLLLDLVELQQNVERFTKLCVPGLVVKSTPNHNAALSEEEELLAQLAKNGEEIGELRARSLLSRYHFQSGVISLLEQKILTPIGRVAPKAPATGAPAQPKAPPAAPAAKAAAPPRAPTAPTAPRPPAPQAPPPQRSAPPPKPVSPPVAPTAASTTPKPQPVSAAPVSPTAATASKKTAATKPASSLDLALAKDEDEEASAEAAEELEGLESQKAEEAQAYDDFLSALEVSINTAFKEAESKAEPEVEEVVEEEEGDVDEIVSGASLGVILSMWSAKLLKENRVPRLLVFCLFVAGIVLPLLTWGKLLGGFADF